MSLMDKESAVNVLQAIAAVSAEMPAVGKDQKMTSGGPSYTYRGIEDITKHLAPLMAKHGVVIVPLVSVAHQEPALDAKPGWHDTFLDARWRIYGPEGDHIDARTAGVGRDNSDKGANKAHSQAYKYLLQTLFCIADKADDSDGISLDHTVKDSRNLGTPQNPEPAQAPVERQAMPERPGTTSSSGNSLSVTEAQALRAQIMRLPLEDREGFKAEFKVTKAQDLDPDRYHEALTWIASHVPPETDDDRAQRLVEEGMPGAVKVS